METIEISVLEYYSRPWYFPFMPEQLFKTLEEAFVNDQKTTLVNKSDFDKMMKDYINIMAN